MAPASSRKRRVSASSRKRRVPASSGTYARQVNKPPPKRKKRSANDPYTFGGVHYGPERVEELILAAGYHGATAKAIRRDAHMRLESARKAASGESGGAYMMSFSKSDMEQYAKFYKNSQN